MKVLIEGAGIAGVALAGFLQKGGVEVTVVEKASAYRNDGYGIILWPLGKRVLGNFGILDEISQKGARISLNKLLDEQERFLYTLDFDAVEKKYGEVLGMKRHDLYDSFLSAVGDLHVLFDTTIEKLHEHEGVVTVQFSSGKEEEFDLVVSASGIMSPIRQELFPTSAIKYYGKRAWITWVKGVELPQHSSLSFLGHGAGAILFPAGDKHVVYFMAPGPKNWVHEEESERLANIRTAFEGFKGVVPEVIDKLDDPSDIMYTCLSKVVSNTWYHKRVVLIGDAEHAMSPISGIGTSLALEDALVLSQELLGVEKEEIPTALSRFAKRRKPRLRQASRLSNSLMFFLLPRSRLVCDLRDFTVRHLVPQSFFMQQVMRMHEFVI